MKKKGTFIKAFAWILLICSLISIFYMSTNIYRAYAIGQEEINLVNDSKI